MGIYSKTLSILTVMFGLAAFAMMIGPHPQAEDKGHSVEGLKLTR